MIDGNVARVRSVYDGPTKVSEFTICGVKLRVARPSDPDRLLDHPDVLDWNRRDDYMPYWAYLWPGAFLLAEAVAREPWVEGQRALEIGCGLGLGGLMALSRGLQVRFTDYDEASFRFIEQSARENGVEPSQFSIERLDWRELPEERYPVILGADVLYERRLVPLVADVLERMLEPDGFAMIADPDRAANEGLPQALASRGLVLKSEPIEAADEHGPVRGTVFRITKQRP